MTPVTNSQGGSESDSSASNAGTFEQWGGKGGGAEEEGLTIYLAATQQHLRALAKKKNNWKLVSAFSPLNSFPFLLLFPFSRWRVLVFTLKTRTVVKLEFVAEHEKLFAQKIKQFSIVLKIWQEFCQVKLFFFCWKKNWQIQMILFYFELTKIGVKF